MGKNYNNTSSGMSISTVLTLIFVVLKLCKIIEWNWIWVLSPLWISIILYLLIFLILYLIYR